MLTIILLPVRAALLGFKAGLLGMKAANKTTRFGVKAANRTTRAVGRKRLLLLGVGVGIGLLVAPVPGRELRAKLRAKFGGLGVGAGDDHIAEKVRHELGHAPATWHLPQPAVSVAGGKVILSGEVPHGTARADLETVASGVPGVVGVENELRVPGTNGSS